MLTITQILTIVIGGSCLTACLVGLYKMLEEWAEL